MPVPAAPAPAPRAPTASGRGWQPPRKIEATPLQSSIRTTSPGAAANPNAPRTVIIKEPKQFPWAVLALTGLILVAVGVILYTVGIVNLPF